MFDKTKVKYIKIMHNQDIGVGIFLFPKGKKSLIHDHPDAMVITKIFTGQLKIRRYQPAESFEAH